MRLANSSSRALGGAGLSCTILEPESSDIARQMGSYLLLGDYDVCVRFMFHLLRPWALKVQLQMLHESRLPDRAGKRCCRLL